MNDTTSRLIAAGTAALTWILLFVYMMRIDARLRRLEKR